MSITKALQPSVHRIRTGMVGRWRIALVTLAAALLVPWQVHAQQGATLDGVDFAQLPGNRVLQPLIEQTATPGVWTLEARLLDARGAEELRRERFAVLPPSAESDLAKVLEQSRLPAKTRILLRDARPIVEVMKEESYRADLAIIGAGIPKTTEDGEAFLQRMDSLLAVLPTTIMVHSARDFDGDPVLFDQ